MINSTVGNYKIQDKLGEGGMGTVYKGIDYMIEREVAIKVLRPELARQQEIVERFRAEAVTLAKLIHPNIATLFNFLRHGNEFFMVMEFVPGTTLENLIQTKGAIPCDLAMVLFNQILDGIAHAHELGIVHRDIKPGNIMITPAGKVKVMDFGIAKVLGGVSSLTREGRIIGTIEYMSPEQINGVLTDARSDIYSLGILLYEMLSGRVPFTGSSEFQVMRAHVEVPPVSPREVVPGLPEQVEQALLKALSKKPQDRFSSAIEFKNSLLGKIGSSPLNTVSPAPVSTVNPNQSEAIGEFQQALDTRLPAASADVIKATRQSDLPLPPGETTQAEPALRSTPVVARAFKETRQADHVVGLVPSAGQSEQANQWQDAEVSGQGSGSTAILRKADWRHYGAFAALILLVVILILMNQSGNTSEKGATTQVSPPAGEASPTTDLEAAKPRPAQGEGIKASAASPQAESSEPAPDKGRDGDEKDAPNKKVPSRRKKSNQAPDILQ